MCGHTENDRRDIEVTKDRVYKAWLVLSFLASLKPVPIPKSPICLLSATRQLKRRQGGNCAESEKRRTALIFWLQVDVLCKDLV